MEGPFEKSFSFRLEKALEKSVQTLEAHRHPSNSCSSSALQLYLVSTGLSRFYTERVTKLESQTCDMMNCRLLGSVKGVPRCPRYRATWALVIFNIQGSHKRFQDTTHSNSDHHTKSIIE